MSRAEHFLPMADCNMGMFSFLAHTENKVLPQISPLYISSRNSTRKLYKNGISLILGFNGSEKCFGDIFASKIGSKNRSIFLFLAKLIQDCLVRGENATSIDFLSPVSGNYLNYFLCVSARFQQAFGCVIASFHKILAKNTVSRRCL